MENIDFLSEQHGGDVRFLLNFDHKSVLFRKLILMIE